MSSTQVTMTDDNRSGDERNAEYLIRHQKVTPPALPIAQIRRFPATLPGADRWCLPRP